MEFVTVVLWSMDLPGVYILSRLAFSVKIERSRVCPNTSKLPSSHFIMDLLPSSGHTFD